MRKILSLTLVLTILLGAFCLFSASADSDEISIKSGNYYYNILNDGSARITDYIGDETKITVPAEIDGYKVTNIGHRAFFACTANEVILPDTITYIDIHAFQVMRNLTKINIPQSVTHIGMGAFEHCKSLSDITLPSGLTYIGQNLLNDTPYYNNPDNWDNLLLYCGNYLIASDKDYIDVCVVKEGTTLIAAKTFQGNKTITSVNLAEGLKYIGDDCFSACTNINYVNIPDSVVSIGTTAFSSCESLEIVDLPQNLSSVGELAFSGTAFYNNPDNWYDGALYSNGVLLQTKPGLLGEYTIKDNTYLVADNAFGVQREITSIIMPDSVKYIGNNSFSGCCKLENIRFSENLAEIPNRALDGCIALDNLKIPSNVTKIGDSAFEDCRSLSSVIIPDTVKEIGHRAFGYKNLKEPSRFADFIIYANKGSASEIYAKENKIHFKEHTEKYKESVFSKDGYYLEIYEHFSTEDEISPHFVLVSAFDDWTADTPCTEQFGDYILHTNTQKLPDGKSGYYIYLPKENKTYTLSEAYEAGIKGVYDLFTNGIIGILRGDIDNNGKLTIQDVTDIQKYLVGLNYPENEFNPNEFTPLIADFNLDGKVNVRDATDIQKRLAKMDNVNLEHRVIGIYSVAPVNGEYPETKVIAKSKEQLDNILSQLPCETSLADIDATFDEAYFEKHNVAVISEFRGSSCCRYFVENAKLNGSTLTLNTLSNSHGQCVPDIYCQCTLIELDKEYTNNIANINLIEQTATIFF